MSALAWGVCCAVACVSIALLIAWRVPHNTNAALAEWASRPDALRDAELVYMERLFRIFMPVGLAAKIDRAYRMPSGLIVLVEFKTRWNNQPLLSDVIQLSAQRVAVMGQTGQPVASYGYVLVKSPIRRLPVPHRVALFSVGDVVAMVERWHDLLDGHTQPCGPFSRKTCFTCVFQEKCKQGSSL